MSRFTFAAVASVVFSCAAAAQVPGRDLLEFPLGTLAEAAALSRQMTASLWNPAATVLAPTVRMQMGIAALTTPYEVGVDARVIGVAYRVRDALTAVASVAQVSVGDIFKTEDGGPQTLGDAIPYGTTVASLGVATRRGAASYGVTARYRWGSIDTTTNGALAFDVGTIVERALGTPLRIAASTFLLSPTGGEEPATLLVAADLPLVRSDSTWTVRGGIAMQGTSGRGSETYLFATARYRMFDARAGLAQSNAFGNVNRRARLGAGVVVGRYAVGIAREDGAAGLGGSYQFLLTSIFR